jgi:hypothetical protein
MGIFPPSPKPRPEALSTTVVGPGGTRYVDCGTVAGIDAHIRVLMAKLTEQAAFPKRVTVLWQDIDELLSRRLELTMETWLSPSDVL